MKYFEHINSDHQDILECMKRPPIQSLNLAPILETYNVTEMTFRSLLFFINKNM